MDIEILFAKTYLFAGNTKSKVKYFSPLVDLEKFGPQGIMQSTRGSKDLKIKGLDLLFIDIKSLYRYKE